MVFVIDVIVCIYVLTKVTNFDNDDFDITHLIPRNVTIDNNFDTDLAASQNRQPCDRLLRL